MIRPVIIQAINKIGWPRRRSPIWKKNDFFIFPDGLTLVVVQPFTILIIVVQNVSHQEN